jgi:hypothetical protein
MLLVCCLEPFRESAGMGGPLNEEEAHVIQGVLDLSSKTGNKAMTPLDKVGCRILLNVCVIDIGL